MLLKDKSVVITGAGSGVGRAAALIFAANGAKVVASDLQLEWVEETVRLVTEAGGQAVAAQCDVRDRSQIEASVARAVEAFGRLDVMFNNAGVATIIDGKRVTFMDQKDDEFERLVAVNYRGVVYGCQAAVEQFRKQGSGGAIVNTASVAGLVGFGGTIYGSTKGAVIALSRSLAIEVAKEGIRVNVVCPAGMMTNFGKTDGSGFAEKTAELTEFYSKLHPLGRPIAPEDCANAALFLASDLSSNITGVQIPVDGGYVAA